MEIRLQLCPREHGVDQGIWCETPRFQQSPVFSNLYLGIKVLKNDTLNW